MADLFPERIETDRLALEAVTGDLDPLALYEHARVGAPHVDEMTAYLTWDPHETPKETAEFLDEAADARENGEGSTYVVRPREGEDGAGELAGMTAIAPDWETRTAELGIWLRKPFWGRGYSGERAGALLSVAFDRLDLDAVVVAVHRDNEKSRAAVSGYVEAHGGRCEGLLRNYHVDGDGEPFDAYRYTVSAEEYRASAAN